MRDPFTKRLPAESKDSANSGIVPTEVNPKNRLLEWGFWELAVLPKDVGWVNVGTRLSR